MEGARLEGPSMGSTLAAQDVERSRMLHDKMVNLRSHEAHLERLLSGKEAKKKLYKF